MSMLESDGQLDGSLWGLVLAAGDGKRLEGYVRELRGKELPKQYVNVIGRRSMLEHTLDRAELRIPSSRILTIINRGHLEHAEVRAQIAARPSATIIIQPENKETGPGILLPLMHLYNRNPEAVVAMFPSDHFVLEEERFMDHVELATRSVARHPERVVLLAMEAQWPETEYGYVVPVAGGGQFHSWRARRVAYFVEKPDLDQARRLVRAGALWNTMVTVFKARNLLNLIQALCPELFSRFFGILDVLGKSAERACVDEVYRNLKPVNFSKDILQKMLTQFPDTLYVLPLREIYWSDWGTAQRISNALQVLGGNGRRAVRQGQEPQSRGRRENWQGTRGVIAAQPRLSKGQ